MDLIKPICEGLYEVQIAPGNLVHSGMNDFYNGLDVLIISSKHEGEPLTLIEAMAAGCFPVCVNVGIVPELITHKVNGFIVEERSPQGFLDAFKWCESNLDFVRKTGIKNSMEIRKIRSWENTIQFFDNVFMNSILYGSKGL